VFARNDAILGAIVTLSKEFKLGWRQLVWNFP